MSTPSPMTVRNPALVTPCCSRLGASGAEQAHPNRNSQHRDRSIDDRMASLIKGMLKRGDEQSDIAACFLINGGRISEINTGKRFGHVKPAPVEELPPAGPYPSPHELFSAG